MIYLLDDFDDKAEQRAERARRRDHAFDREEHERDRVDRDHALDPVTARRVRDSDRVDPRVRLIG